MGAPDCFYKTPIYQLLYLFLHDKIGFIAIHIFVERLLGLEIRGVTDGKSFSKNDNKY